MYVSKYYTCEEIDQRLLQGYFDDFLNAGFVGTINEFWAFVLSIKDKVDKKDGYELSKNDFTDALKAKLDGIEEKANYITLVSQLINDKKYQTYDEVRKMISDLVDGADDALDTLKELAEALGNDPNFATTITNKLTDLRTALSEEVARAKEEEGKLAVHLKNLNDNFLKAVDLLNEKIDTINVAIVKEINRVEVKVDKNTSDISQLKSDTIGQIAEAKVYAKDLVDAEALARKTADDNLKQGIHDLENKHIKDLSDITSKIDNEALLRTNADTALDSKINEEVTNRQSDTQMLQGKINEEVTNRKSADAVIQENLSQEVINRENEDSLIKNDLNKEAQKRESEDRILQNNIDNEASTRIAQDLILDHKISDIDAKVDNVETEILGDLAQERAERIAADEALDLKKVDKREGYALSKNDFTDLLKSKLDGIEEKANYITLVSQLINDSNYQTDVEVEAAIQKIIGSAPEVLDTLEEIARALGEDPNFASTITKKLAAITEQVNQETEDRTAADTLLQTNITTEVSDRKAADLAVEAKVKEYVDTEIDKLEVGADTIAKDLAKEIADRKAADDAIKIDLDKETTDRKTADTAHNTAITEINKRISDLALDFQDKVNILKNTLDQRLNQVDIKINSLESSDTAIKAKVAEMDVDISDNYNELKGLIDEEITDRTYSDSSFTSKIELLTLDLNTEVSTRTAGDSVLQSIINQEVTERTSADKELKAELSTLINTNKAAQDFVIGDISYKLDQEVTNRKAAVDGVKSLVDSNQQLNNAAHVEITTKLNEVDTSLKAEIQRSVTKDESLKSDITTMNTNHRDDMAAISKDINVEANTRLLEDTNLQNNINKEEVDRKNADLLLENAIAQEKADRNTSLKIIEDSKVDKVDGKGLSSNDFTDIIFAKLMGIEEMANYVTKISQLANDKHYQTDIEVEAAIQKIIGSAPGILNTLEEIAKALGDDPNFATTMTKKLNDLTAAIEAEKLARETGDNDIRQSFTNLSTTLNGTVTELKTFVSQTRTELLTSLNASNVLITQNSSNIQRNLELIQGLQEQVGEPGYDYTALKDLLNNEISARKAEDIRIEAKIDKGSSDLGADIEDLKEADIIINGRIDQEIIDRKAEDNSQTNRMDSLSLRIKENLDKAVILEAEIDQEVIDRTAADVALGKRIDKEVLDRTTADTLLNTKIDLEIKDRNEGDRALREDLDKEIVGRTEADDALNGQIKIIGDTFGSRLDTEEAMTDSLPDSLITQILVDQNPDHITLSTRYQNKEDNPAATSSMKYGEILTNNLVLGPANGKFAGLMTAGDKSKLDFLFPNPIYELDLVSIGEDLTIIQHHTPYGSEVNPKPDRLIQIPTATFTHSGVMSIDDKNKLDVTLPALIQKEVDDRETDTEAINQSISEVTKNFEDFKASKSQPGGLAALDKNGTVPANQLPSYVDDILEVYATYDKSPTGQLSNIKLYEDAAHTKLISGEAGKIYQNIEGNIGYQFRWSGTQFAHIDSGGLVIGDITGTAYDGGLGKSHEVILDLLSREWVQTPHYSSSEPYVTQDPNYVQIHLKYTKFDVHNPDNRHFSNQFSLPQASSNGAGCITAKQSVLLTEGLPNQITQEVTDRKQAITDLDIALKKYVDDKVAVINTNANSIKALLDSHIANTLNPHSISKTQIGLGNVSNTAPLDLPVSNAQATAIADAKAAGTSAKSLVDSHVALKNNPHTVTRAQLGLAATDQVVFAKTTAPSGFFKETSDERLKSDIREMNHTLEQICNIPTKSFNIQGTQDEGTIAQGLEAQGLGNYVEETPVLRELIENPEEFKPVDINGENYVMVKEVKYHKMSILAIEGIKLLKAELDELRSELSNLKNNK